jgi:hypothetical protein
MKNKPFQGSLDGLVFLLGVGLCSLRSQMRGFHDLLREKPSSLLMLLGWSSISVTSVMIQPLLFRSYISPLLPCLSLQPPKMETACFFEMSASTCKYTGTKTQDFYNNMMIIAMRPRISSVTDLPPSLCCLTGSWTLQ